jgi:BED zinc finger
MTMQVIARAATDEPVMLHTVGEAWHPTANSRRSTVIHVTRRPEFGITSALPFHLEWLYAYTEADYVRLREAFDSGDADKLANAWRATPSAEIRRPAQFKQGMITCPTCGREFSRSLGLSRHMRRRVPCSPSCR